MMDAQDWTGLIIASNEAAMQWYSMVTQKPLPSQPDVFSTPLPGGGGIRVGTQTGSLILIGVIVLVVFMVLKD